VTVRFGPCELDAARRQLLREGREVHLTPKAFELRIVLVDGDNVIGRDPEANVQLDYSTVSRRHARVVVTATSTTLEDLGSKNGTTIGGAKLAAPVELRNGDRFACGQVLLVYRESRAGFPTATHVSVTNEATGRR
jgi:pSer/pThr/pTyr-binding forkhead associated (FHA) protein